MSLFRRLSHITALLFALAAAHACRDQPPAFNNGNEDAGNGVDPTPCSRREDCGGLGICVGGVCEAVQPCQSDDQCTAEGKVCHTTRGYCVQCDGRHAGECPIGQTCQFDFTCVAIGGGNDGGTTDAGSCSGACGDRTMCGADQVCRNGSCCAPPPRCVSPNDCPSTRPECNGATGECFGGDSCTRDDDCENKPGCAGGACHCDAPAAGQPGECRARPDACQNDQECYAGGMYDGKFCSLMQSPRLCLAAPSCTTDTECANAGLVCDLTMGSPSYQRCINGTPCPNGNECNPTTQLCSGGMCVAKNCLNTPGFCDAQTELCDQTTGACTPMQSSNCTDNSQCQAGFWCNTAQNRCEPGCRDSTECSGGVCNASHRCEQPTGSVCGACASNADCPAGTECRENTFTGAMLCYESCNAFTGQGCTLNPSAMCIILRCACI